MKEKDGYFTRSIFAMLQFRMDKYNLLTKKSLKSIGRSLILSKKNFFLLRISPKVWFSFKGIKKLSLLVNTITGIHNDEEILKNNISK